MSSSFYLIRYLKVYHRSGTAFFSLRILFKPLAFASNSGTVVPPVLLRPLLWISASLTHPEYIVSRSFSATVGRMRSSHNSCVLAGSLQRSIGLRRHSHLIASTRSMSSHYKGKQLYTIFTTWSFTRPTTSNLTRQLYVPLTFKLTGAKTAYNSINIRDSTVCFASGETF
jgi:hypothetical protein